MVGVYEDNSGVVLFQQRGNWAALSTYNKFMLPNSVSEESSSYDMLLLFYEYVYSPLAACHHSHRKVQLTNSSLLTIVNRQDIHRGQPAVLTHTVGATRMWLDDLTIQC